MRDLAILFRPFTRHHLPTCKTWWHPFCHCGVGARQASTGDPQSFAGTRIQPSTVGSDHHRVMHAPDASSTCHPLCDCVSAIHCFSSDRVLVKRKHRLLFRQSAEANRHRRGRRKNSSMQSSRDEGAQSLLGLPSNCGADYVSLRPRDQ